MPVSVIIPYYQTPAETLDRTLAALERQTYPRELFEVIIVDDGSEPPLEPPLSTPLNVKVARQERRGFGAARARNAGARAAAHNILLFLDSDIMAEAAWIAAHARWHHAVSDAITLGRLAFVSADGIDAETVRRRRGSLRRLFSDRANDPSWTESHMARTNNLTSRDDDLFRTVASGNFGISKTFYWEIGGFDESFTRYGMEDIELGYRAYTRGGLLVPETYASAWHQSRWSNKDRDVKGRSNRLQRRKAANLIAHPQFRGNQPGRIFQVPQFVVSLDTGGSPREREAPTPDVVAGAVLNILADRERDLVVRIETRGRDDDKRMEPLHDEFDAEPRVLVAPTRPALEEFPVSPFQITLPASISANNLVYRLRALLGSAAAARATLPDGNTVSITRAWALHRARRAGGSPTDFGEARTIPAKALKLKSAAPVHYYNNWDTLLGRMRRIRSPADVWRLSKGLAIALRWRAAIKRGRRP